MQDTYYQHVVKVIPTVSRRRLWIALGTVGLLLVVVFAVECRRRQQLYWYDAAGDYRYRFEDAERVPVEVAGGEFTLPASTSAADTTLLRLRVDGTLLGRWFEPYIVAGTDTGMSARQYLERGVSGLRYLDLGPARDRPPGTRIRLAGHHVTWPEQSADLLSFRNPDLDGRRILVVAPHPDDGEIAAFGAYAFRDSWLLTLTAGNYADGLYARIDGDRGTVDRLRGDVRAWDSLAVPIWGGMPPSRSIQLGLAVGSLEALHRGEISPAGWGDDDVERVRRANLGTFLDGHPAPRTWDDLIVEISSILERVAPEIVIAPEPAFDAARDHGFSTLALLQAADRSGLSPYLLLYTNHHVHTEYYPFGPAGSRVTLPPWFDETLSVPAVASLELDDRRQTEKLFALEAMHDLRAPPAPVRAEGPLGRFLGRVAENWSDLRRDPFGTYSYFRRAVRPNELFFVYPPSRMAELERRVERQLARP